MAETATPSHHRIAERVARMARQRGKYAQSILIHGPQGAGQREAAIRFGQSIFCEVGEGEFGACGKCRGCRRVREGTHPDWLWLEPDRAAKGLPNISIESVRNLQDRLVLNPYEGVRVVGCLFEAEKMRPEAANSLLKLVEEPPPHALFILVTNSLERVLPTIRSRCLPVPLGPPDPDSLAAVIRDELGVSETEALQGALWALQEGTTPAEALSETARDLREDAIELLNLAIHRGEDAFIPVIKNKKHPREACLAILRLFRDLLFDVFVLGEGRSDPLVYRSHNGFLMKSAKVLSPKETVDLIDATFEFEEGIQGYANPTQAIVVFLGQVARAAGR